MSNVRAGHGTRTGEVRVSTPGIGGAEGQEKGKGVPREVGVTKWDVLYKSGVYVLKALCLTPGGLYGV